MEKKSVGTTNQKVSNYIHDDIAFSILSKLPLKSLKRFQCIRKSFSLIFENQLFHNNFLSNLHCCSYYDQSSLLLKNFNEINYFQEVFYILSGERFQTKLELNSSNQYPFKHIEYFITFGFGSVNGMICLSQYLCSQLILWNPTTNQFKIIPPSPAESSIPEVVKDFLFAGCDIHGFGYDSVADDYKLIRHVCFSSLPYECCKYVPPEDLLRDIKLEPLWEIYSLKSNSWRKLDVDMPASYESRSGGTHVYMDGVCHWLVVDVARHSRHFSLVGPCLVSFYLTNDMFFTTPIPSDVDNPSNGSATWITLVILNGYITLISYREQMTTFQISILGDFGVKESWTKLFIVGPLLCVEHPIGVGTKGEIFFVRKDEEICWFDLNTQMIEEFGAKGGGTTQIIIYKENIRPI